MILSNRPGGEHHAPGVNPDGFLGRSMAGQIPGVRTVSPFAGPAAFGLGVDAAKMGQNEDACPFPEGSSLFQEWMMGFLHDGSVLGRAGWAHTETQEAWREGYDAARTGGAKDEVKCAHAPRSRAYTAWLAGFKAGGGIIQ